MSGSGVRVALIGFGNVGRSFLRLVHAKQAVFPFRIVGVHTRHGGAIDNNGLPPEPQLSPPAASVDEFLDAARPEVAVEITTLNPDTGEPAISHIRSAFARGQHVITANKGPIAHAYHCLSEDARRAGVEFRFESTVMDGAPVFNMMRNDLPGVTVNGFTGALNSTTKVVLAAMRHGKTRAEGIAEAQKIGVAEADASHDIEGWDSAVKTAALANVLMDARVTPRDVERTGIEDVTVDRVCELARKGKSIVLVSRAYQTDSGLRLRVRPEVLEDKDLLATVHGTSNVLMLHTDLMGTLGSVSITPGVPQTAYGLFSDLVDIARTI